MIRLTIILAAILILLLAITWTLLSHNPTSLNLSMLSMKIKDVSANFNCDFAT
nr:MAG TPA: hypothetical protein [Caudoviricetes sp.]